MVVMLCFVVYLGGGGGGGYCVRVTLPGVVIVMVHLLWFVIT